MRNTLKPGLSHEFTFRVPESKTVPHLYPEATEFQAMPVVFATGFMVGFIEWTCVQAINPHLDWPAEMSVGTHLNLSHLAATPPGMAVTAQVKLVEVQGRRLLFEIEARDEVDVISKGTHERFVIDAEKFEQRLKAKMG